MRQLFAVMFCLLLTTSQCYALQAPVSNMQNTVSGVVQNKMLGRGFITSDPRFSSTLYQASAVAANTALAGLSVAGTVAGASWATMAAGFALGGVVGFVGVGIVLAATGQLDWMFKDDGKVQIGETPPSLNTPAGLAPPSAIYYVGNVIGTTPTAACNGQPVISGALPGDTTWTMRYSWNGSQCIGWQTNTNTVTGKVYPEFNAGPINIGSATGNTTRCPGINLSATGGKCPASNFAEPNPAPVKPVGDAIADIPDEEKLKPLNPRIIADLANEMWREAAAAPGYSGIPYDATNPITVEEATQYETAHPTTWPTVGDFVAPQTASPGTSSGSPFVLPTASTPVATQDPTSTPQTGTNPSTEPLQNLGSDPGIGAPALEPIPTAQQILQPLLNLFPTLKNFAVPNHNATCPKWSVNLFNRDIPLQDHCPLLEQVRPTAYATMAAVWILIALFIVLAA